MQPSISPRPPNPPVSPRAADVRSALDVCLAHLAVVPDDAWEEPAAGLDWTCRETAAHVLGDLGAYALQLAGTGARIRTYTPLAAHHPRAGRPGVWFWPEEDGGTDVVVQCLDDVGGLLVAVVASAPPERVRWHPYGDSDRTGFAAMGMTEVLLHTHDILAAHDIEFAVSGELVEPVLARIFPATARSQDPWRDLRAATGRTAQTRGRPWRWDSRVPDPSRPERPWDARRP